MKYSFRQQYELLEEAHDRFNRTGFIQDDPISVPHLFTKKTDIEIAGFMSAIIAWGQRKTIVKNAKQLVEWMDYTPHDFIINSKDADRTRFGKFSHRTFNGTDCIWFLKALQYIYSSHNGLENVFCSHTDNGKVFDGIINLKRVLFRHPHPARTTKHISDPRTNAACKRLNMFLRWMVRKDKRGVDFGIWSKIKPHELICPLDLHSARTAREIGILKRTQNDWKAAGELTEALKQFDASDPVKYDFALFGLGVSGSRIPSPENFEFRVI